MRHILVCCAAVLTLSTGAAFAEPQPGAAPSAADAASTSVSHGYSTSRTQIGVLMADPAARAVLVRHIPAFGENASSGGGAGGGLDQASAMTLRELAQAVGAYGGDMFAASKLDAIDVDLAALPATH